MSCMFNCGILACGNREGALASEVRCLDSPAGEKGSRNTNSAEDDLLQGRKEGEGGGKYSTRTLR